MFLTLDEILKMQEAQIRAFVARKIPEATGFIDYKQAIFKGSSRDDEYRELLKDVTGFANSQGGHILYGVSDPSSTRDGVDPVIGVENGVADAKAFENVAANSIDPRLSGFRVIPISIENGRHVLIAHIPPDGMRPHRVNHNQTKTWNFYVRHGEAIRMMTTQEIRDSVLSAATSEQKAIRYAEEQANEFLDDLNGPSPVFFIQAVPLVPLDKLWVVTEDKFRPVMLGSHRRNVSSGDGFHDWFSFRASNERIPTLRGARAEYTKGYSDTVHELHRNGWIGAFVKLGNKKPTTGPYQLFSRCVDIFPAFADFCEEAIQIGEAERPYLLRARVYNVSQIRMVIGNNEQIVSMPYQKNEIKFIDLRRENGQPFREAVHPWRQMFVNAFGLELPDA